MKYYVGLDIIIWSIETAHFNVLPANNLCFQFANEETTTWNEKVYNQIFFDKESINRDQISRGMSWSEKIDLPDIWKQIYKIYNIKLSYKYFKAWSVRRKKTQLLSTKDNREESIW